MSFLINPYAFLAAGGDYESIATVSVGSGGASSIEFTSIPGTYQHLQVRGVGKESGGTTDYQVYIQLNGDSASNYSRHLLFGDGSSAGAAAGSSVTVGWVGSIAAGSKTYFGATIIDILDYSNASKYKVTRTLAGNDQNGSGSLLLSSTLWMSTSAVTSIKLLPAVSGFVQHSTFALYGIKA